MSLNLNDAAMAGNLEEVLIRLNLGEDVNQKYYPRYSTPLHDAVCCGREEVCKLLIERGANVNELDYKNMTPLKLAKRYGQDAIEVMLTAAGAKEFNKFKKLIFKK
ncbi:26S proteasome non-ATPase regulatory subunit 10 [Eurytemora carolleeae]|uniref:26S proteasome non-ATPase regulatory subunit 10 n=1 Tax=Eurytemora carolleeae TaxID=1294199 RepID=UPI000C768988|nr:26S proteasome non-ATPase regulatory subunit 10 [Eurytemora carolleeae]|eukprot:XP_023323276.1 26S proteasome non-ATPase regulatory subunit 10-like [Eurytemora affinis]